MGIDAERFAAALTGLYPMIRAEGETLTREEFVPWPLYDSYVGDWLVFPLFLRSWPEQLGVDFAANQRRCPRTTAALQAIGACSAAFSRMEPGCQVLAHQDAPDPGVLRAHLGLVVPKGCFLRIGDNWHEWREGAVLMFDGQIEHEAKHVGRQSRLVLLADYQSPA